MDAAFLIALALAQAASPPASERTAIFRAAGAVQRGGRWVMCADDPTNPVAIVTEYRDLNGDKRPEALINEGGTFCYGHAGGGYSLVSKQADGRWKLITKGTGMPAFLTTTGVGGWPDIEVGGPGFCFPVERWNGTAYSLNRHEYEGKRCRPN